MGDFETGDQLPPMEDNDCRMYEQQYPEVDDLVMVQVRSIAEMGAYVSLLEYNNVEGMILLSELSRRRIRSISKLIRVGRQEVVVVLRVDKEKGYIDLSKRRVSPEDIVKCEEKYNKSKAVHSIMRHVSETQRISLVSLYETFGWALYKKFGHAYEAFKLAINDPDVIFGDFNMADNVKEHLLKNIQRRLTPQPVKLRADVEATCFNYEGIEAIRKALSEGKSCGTEEIPVSIKLVAPPLYVISTTSLDKEKGLAILQESVDKIQAKLTELKGELNVKVAPRAVSERDDRVLTSLLKSLEQQNQEVDGDDDYSDSD
eukprot:GFYU01010804.1.p1 GENE.GFYU01010804.1~~GFYU01010804.1.p1  ORF type:complete len:316 (-),score=125.05 GFYU01010804.1:719-1666(-)